MARPLAFTVSSFLPMLKCIITAVAYAIKGFLPIRIVSGGIFPRGLIGLSAPLCCSPIGRRSLVSDSPIFFVQSLRSLSWLTQRTGLPAGLNLSLWGKGRDVEKFETRKEGRETGNEKNGRIGKTGLTSELRLSLSTELPCT